MARVGKYLTFISLALLVLGVGIEAVLSPGGPGPTLIQSVRLQSGKVRQKPATDASERLSTSAPARIEELSNQPAVSLATEPVPVSRVAHQDATGQKEDEHAFQRNEIASTRAVGDTALARRRAKREAASRRQDEMYYRYHAPVSPQAHQRSLFPFFH